MIDAPAVTDVRQTAIATAERSQARRRRTYLSIPVGAASASPRRPGVRPVGSDRLDPISRRRLRRRRSSIWPRISPPGIDAECTFAYVRPCPHRLDELGELACRDALAAGTDHLGSVEACPRPHPVVDTVASERPRPEGRPQSPRRARPRFLRSRTSARSGCAPVPRPTRDPSTRACRRSSCRPGASPRSCPVAALDAAGTSNEASIRFALKFRLPASAAADRGDDAEHERARESRNRHQTTAVLRPYRPPLRRCPKGLRRAAAARIPRLYTGRRWASGTRSGSASGSGSDSGSSSPGSSR